MKSVDDLALDLIYDQRVRLGRCLAKNKPLFVKVHTETTISAKADHVLKNMQAQRTNPEYQRVLLEQVISSSRHQLRVQKAQKKAQGAKPDNALVPSCSAPPEGAGQPLTAQETAPIKPVFEDAPQDDVEHDQPNT